MSDRQPDSESEEVSSEPWVGAPPPPPPPAPSRPDGEGTGNPAGERSDSPRIPTGSARPGTTFSALRKGLNGVGSWSPWNLGPAAIVAAFAVSWLGSIIESFRHEPGVDSQYRILVFFSPGSLEWAAVVLLGVAMVAAGRRFTPDAVGGDQTAIVTDGLLGAGLVVSVSAAADVLVELTNFGHGIDDAFVALLSYLAVIPVSAAASWWAYSLRPTRRS